ncbi:hypothetical protein CL653_01015 [bacterium]|nr:hypothetical protein [bacterium]|tara:strand:- start:29 stop:448 length:420 start_codon:yes stop_codon:yes gene_type:complete
MTHKITANTLPLLLAVFFPVVEIPLFPYSILEVNHALLPPFQKVQAWSYYVHKSRPALRVFDLGMMSKQTILLTQRLEKNLYVFCFFPRAKYSNSRAGKSYEQSELDLDAKSLIAHKSQDRQLCCRSCDYPLFIKNKKT